MKKLTALFLTGVLAAGTVITSFAFDNIERGDKGDRVKEIQELLISSGYLSEEADGLFGKTTETAVIKYQEEHHLDATGVVGEATYEHLKEDAEAGEALTEADDEALTEALSEESIDEDLTENVTEGDAEEATEDLTESLTETLTEESLEEEMTEGSETEWVWSGDTTVLEGYEVKGRLFEDLYGTLYYVAVKNNTTKSAQLTGTAFAYDADNKLIGYSDLEIGRLGSDELGLGNFYFEGVMDVDHVEYTLEAKPAGYYSPRLKDFSYELTENETNIIVQVTNNGRKAAGYLEGYVLFLDSDDNIMDVGSDFIVDDDLEIKPGETQYAQINFYLDEPYDHYEFYLN